MNPSGPATASHVILMREGHAQQDFEGSDFDRPLTAEGRAAVLASAKAMHDAGHHPGPLLVSTALRARQSAQVMAAQLRLPADDIHFVDGLYDAPPEVLEARIKVLARPYTLVTLIAHNPGITDLARFLARQPDAPVMQPSEWRYLPWPPP